ncbi:prepilin-type N-terminal cleavage/methylation domain-containing protein [Candidatus Daviesbacteria bacterium]|nr:prepilin-type N-terminal cleavage/methylation domain-containing protein [Candidatus Daviesbacteria bacterium]
MSKNAFTLVEVLVVLGVLSILGLIVLTIFTRSLRGTNKTQIILSIKENGQSVLENIDKNIRNADNLVCVSSNTVVLFKEGTYTRYRISEPQDSSTSPTCSENGCIAFDSPQPLPEEITPEEFINRLGQNRICSSTDPLLSPTILTDTDEEKGVLVSNGLFELDRKEGFKDSLNVKFTLEAPPGAPEALRGQIDPVIFETTIQLR